MSRFIISDLHLGHANIIKYCDRPFSSVDEMNSTLIDNWNSVVRSDDDIVYFLGDFCFGHKEQMKTITRDYREKLNGKIHFILGNHDKHIDHAAFESVQNYLILEKYNRLIILCHYPLHRKSEYPRCGYVPSKYDVNFYGHVHNSEQEPAPKNHYNVSCEMINYTPLNLDVFLENNYGN